MGRDMVRRDAVDEGCEGFFFVAVEVEGVVACVVAGRWRW